GAVEACVGRRRDQSLRAVWIDAHHAAARIRRPQSPVALGQNAFRPAQVAPHHVELGAVDLPTLERIGAAASPHAIPCASRGATLTAVAYECNGCYGIARAVRERPMKLATFQSRGGPMRVGAVLPESGQIVDLQAAHEAVRGAVAPAFTDMQRLIEGGDESL